MPHHRTRLNTSRRLALALALTSLGWALGAGCSRSGFGAGPAGTRDGAGERDGADLETLVAATSLTWVESSPVFRNVAHARWTPSTIAGGSSERVALYQDSTQCQSPVGGWQQVTTPGAFTFDVVGEHLYSFRVETRDASGRIVTSPCSPQLDVRRFDWTTLGPRYWPELRDRMQAVIVQGVTQAVAVRQITSATFAAVSGGRFQGAILVPGGTIYGIPRVAPQIATLDFASSTTPQGKLVGPTLGGVDTWYGAALARNGAVYSPPSDIAYVLRFDPAQIAQAAPINTVDLGAGSQKNKWVGLRLAPNGLLIACPRKDERVLVIDPADTSPGGIRRVGPSLGTAEKWIGGVLAPNGKIYCIPSHAAQILEIDPDNLTATGIKKVGPDFGTKGTKWWGGALGANGNIYAVPYRDTKVLEIVPDNITQSRRVGPDFGVSPETGGGNWTWGTLAPNGKIYAVPGNRDHVLEIDPADPTLTGIHRVGPKLAGSTYQKYFSAVLAPNGKLYAFPWFGTSTILEIDPHARGKFDTDLLLNGHLNGQ
ncbi:MAG: hypothetical protein KAI47_15245 [Deltaproteobacteria bacterium]|nr:hypothetical protein [Deltaproteobacteria bacterium]